MDVILVAARGGLTNLESRVGVWFGPLVDTLGGPPALTIETEGAGVGTELADVDGDGARELYRPTVEISIPAIVRILLFQELEVRYDFFELDRTAPWDPEDPEVFCELEQSFEIDLSGLENAPAPLFDLNGDLDGDGVRDVVLGTAEKGFEVLPGELEDGTWCADDDGLTVPLEDPVRVEVLAIGARRPVRPARPAGRGSGPALPRATPAGGLPVPVP